VERARSLRAEGDLGGARERLAEAHEVAPDAAAVRLELADVLLAEGRDLGRVRALLGERPVLDPSRWHLLDARLAELEGDDGRAVEAYARSLETHPDPDARLRRASALERLGRGDEATSELERVRADRPDDLLSRLRLADRYEAAERLAEAEAELRAVIAAQPERASGWERLARFYERTGRTKDARVAFARAKDASRSERELRPLQPSRR
jgi:predicted Zn-dependent protease